MEKEEIKNDNQFSVEERIETFLKGNMTLEEAAKFRQEMKDKEELRMKALSMALLIRGIQKVGKEQDRAIINEIKPVTSKIRYYILQGLAVAACVCFIFTIYDYYDAKYETNSLAMAYIDNYNPPLPDVNDISRGRGDVLNIETERKVLTELNNVFESIRKGEENQKCIEYLKPKFDLAASSKLNNYTPYLKHIGYYLALAQLKGNDRKAAKGTLHSLLKVDPEFSKAKELLDKISGIRCYWE